MVIFNFMSYQQHNNDLEFFVVILQFYLPLLFFFFFLNFIVLFSDHLSHIFSSLISPFFFAMSNSPVHIIRNSHRKKETARLPHLTSAVLFCCVLQIRDVTSQFR